ncbi:MAG TPA: NAD(P)/FAD-dependent oxidoreductase, partial [Acidimicrobiales bacterium]|nr:NAD(P)/FAD-dependent oxidoreductase [Acidimicrobiales bacterium]
MGDTSTSDAAVVVGSGPNGLTAAVVLAQAGLSVTVLEAAETIGGGTRSAELTVPGVLHDICSAVHPFGAASPVFRSLPLERHGLEWRWPEVDLVHPLDGGRAGVFLRSIDETAAGLGDDGPAWRQVFGRASAAFPDLADDILRPLVHVPRHPVGLVSFGLRALLPATWLARRFRTDEARALFAGIAAHVIHPLSRPATAAGGIMLTASGHHVGWPVAAGGSQAVTTALAGLLAELGGTVETGVRVTSLADLPPARLKLFDTSPSGLLAIAGDALPERTRRALRRWRYGPASFKLDLAVEGGVPWTAEAARRAGTVHVGGPIGEIAVAEAEVHRGRLPERPFVLVAQQYLADPARSAGDVHPVWAYAHVPRGYDSDVTEPILRQLERFAPGVRERIVGQHVMSPADFAGYNANYVGGDISTGANTLRQLVFRPRVALDPYATGLPGVYLCSAATPPGAGVHGMCGYHAARSALRSLG